MAYTEDFHDGDVATRVWDLGTNKLRAKRTDPYGFVYVSYEKGPVPEELGSAYTSFYEAAKAVESYIARKGKEVKVS